MFGIHDWQVERVQETSKARIVSGSFTEESLAELVVERRSSDADEVSGLRHRAGVLERADHQLGVEVIPLRDVQREGEQVHRLRLDFEAALQNEDQLARSSQSVGCRDPTELRVELAGQALMLLAATHPGTARSWRGSRERRA